jgi:hypothetical protein
MMSLWNGQQYFDKQESSKNLTLQGLDSGRASPDIAKVVSSNHNEAAVNARVVVPFAVRLHRRLTSNSFKTDPDSLDSMPLF